MNDFSNLTYRGEGNNTVVLANTKLRTVYRFRKTLDASLSVSQYKKTQSYLKELTDTSKFIENVMQKLLGDDIIHKMNILEVNSDYLAKINQFIQPHRPAYRCHKNIDDQYTHIIEAHDATLLPQHTDEETDGPTLSVELKPKLGCIPQFEGVPQIKREFCRFCIMKFHPSKVSLWGSRSQYCPCDLFSGNRERMRIAIESLLVSPQINLRIFMNASPIFTCSLDKLDENLHKFFTNEFIDKSTGGATHNVKNLLIDLIIEALLISNNSNRERSPLNGLHHNNTPAPIDDIHYHLLSSEVETEKALAPPLPSSPQGSNNLFNPICCGTLPLIHLPIDQSSSSFMVPFTQVCHLQPHAQKYKNSHCQLPADSALGRILKVQNLAKCDILPLQKHYDNVKKFLIDKQLTWDWAKVGGLCHDNSIDVETLNSLQIVSDFLISMVAKDCSLMIAFRRAKKLSLSSTTINNKSMTSSTALSRVSLSGFSSQFLVHTSLIDLDPKPIIKLDEHILSEPKILSHFQDSFYLSSK